MHAQPTALPPIVRQYCTTPSLPLPDETTCLDTDGLMKTADVAMYRPGQRSEILVAHSLLYDAVIVDTAEWAASGNPLPAAAITRLFTALHCPAIVTPGMMRRVDEVVYFCDGSPSSLAAIKGSVQLLPAMAGLPAWLLTLARADDELLDHRRHLSRWLHRQARSVRTDTLRTAANEQEAFAAWMALHSHALLVTGCAGLRLLRFWARGKGVLPTQHIPLLIAPQP